jgi:hypothetical protein
VRSEVKERKAASDCVGEDQNCVGSNDLDQMTGGQVAIAVSCRTRGG